MTCEQQPINQPEFDPYQEAMAIYDAVVEFLKKTGQLRYPSQIQDQDELDDHFDDLARVYERTLDLLGLEGPSAQSLPPQDK